jgi:hypothetical protein
MSSNRKWYNWPNGYYETSWVPWYNILRTLIFLPLVALTFGMLYLSVVLMNGISDAEDVRKNFW